MKSALDTENHEAERAVIAALVRNPDGQVILRLGISPDLFSLATTREAFVAIAAFIADGVPPDAAILRSAVSDAVLIEVETSLRGHVSSANLPVYVKLLKDCRRERKIQAARARLAQAATMGATEIELSAILETLTAIGAEKESKWQFGLRVCESEKLRTAELMAPVFTIKPILPRDQITLFGGHGGGGKTLVSYVFAIHVACGKDWGPFRILSGKVLLVSYEDPEELVLWRLRNIADNYGLDLDSVIKNIKIIDATEAEPIMREYSERGIKKLQSTSAGDELFRMISNEKYDLVIIDNSSDAFDGDENNRRQVRQFIRYLATAIRAQHGALMLLAHIDKMAARFGAGGNSYSGSTAWHNSVRSRLALVDGELRQEKLNTAKRMENPIKLSFSVSGVPICDDGQQDAAARAARAERDRADEAALLHCFAAAHAAGATVPTAERGSSTTWHALNVYPEFPPELRDDKERFRQALARLVQQREITREPYRDANRNPRERYALVRVTFKTNAEVNHPIPPACVTFAGGMGETNADRNSRGKTHAIPLSTEEKVTQSSSLARPSTCVSFPEKETHAETHAPPPPENRPAPVCSWDRWGDRLLTRCAAPEPNADRTGCANCGASKP